MLGAQKSIHMHQSRTIWFCKVRTHKRYAIHLHSSLLSIYKLGIRATWNSAYYQALPTGAHLQHICRRIDICMARGVFDSLFDPPYFRSSGPWGILCGRLRPRSICRACILVTPQCPRRLGCDRATRVPGRAGIDRMAPLSWYGACGAAISPPR